MNWPYSFFGLQRLHVGSPPVAIARVDCIKTLRCVNLRASRGVRLQKVLNKVDILRHGRT